ncbi:hypothetical protein SAMN02746066_04321 [Anaerosporobacter mobilis DSM 15930]|uniref:Uncharacterized protein n=1 Tax=Anaerosporobacter mobilis DSM 15930 TaxID=1120996 RepID=A0A1M7N9L5_9FIRM|nr:hypothetical protein [Anaerosporobacter mobilis]SHN00326.1 hypothetical protein SAMN02746066_04321 [Anaerosporobacter mobilis DSM 15930]
MDISNLEPGIYILECIEEFGYDECFFWWTKGKKYRMEIDRIGGCNITCDIHIFTPMGNRFEEMMESFVVEKDMVNKKLG